MIIRRLTDDAYNRIIIPLQETLEKRERGYGVVEVEVDGLLFAIPIRTTLKHKHGFKTIIHGKSWSGLDYSKAVIIEHSDLHHEAFKFRTVEEYKKVKENKKKIENSFNKYVKKYITHHLEGKDSGQLFFKFGHTTLVNYHEELGIK